jgi:hypothetical protein
MIWLYIPRSICMENQPIVITTNACVNDIEVFKMTVELPHGLKGLEGKFEEQPIPTSESSKEDLITPSYKALDRAGYRMSPAVFGNSMWTRHQSPAIFTDYAGAGLAGGLPTPHPIDADWIRKFADNAPPNTFITLRRSQRIIL